MGHKLDTFFAMEKEDIVGNSQSPDTHLYRIKENGLIVRRVFVDTGIDAAPKHILLLSDTHLSTWNLRDFEEKNPCILECIDKRRSTFRREDCLENTERIMEYAPLFDKVIVAGDVIDYLTWGAVDYIKRYIYEKAPDAMVLLGSHDVTRVMGHTLTDPTTLESREEIIKTVVKTDIYYCAEPLGDHALLIGLNNGQSKYSQEQAEKLKADIRKAREESRSILIFQHEPICTHNPAEKEIKPLYISSPGNFYVTDTLNFCDFSKRIGGADSSDTTMEVYRLICENADVIKGVFCGHWHNTAYTEIIGSYMENNVKKETVIPQYVGNAAAYDKGHITVITVR